MRRNVGIQTITPSKEYISPSVAVQHNLEIMEYPKFVVLPHSLTTLAFACLAIFYLAFVTNGTFETNSKNAIIALVVAVLAYSSIYLPDSTMRRPHPVFWRLVQGMALIYLGFVIFILCQSREDARNFLTFFDSNLNRPLVEKDYASDCSLSSHSFPYFSLRPIWDNIDVYVVCHLLGWFFKMMMVRNFYFCWFLSIFFELLEITFRYWLPNFYECWWDQVILDVFGANALGIWMGSIVVQWMDMKNFKWIGENKLDANSNDQSNQNKTAPKKNIIKRFFASFKIFAPNNIQKYDWQMLSSTKRFYSIIWYVIFMNLVDLSNFFNKHLLWLPSDHWLLQIRIWIWALLSTISTSEYYEYITNKNCIRLGHNVWLAHVILFGEAMIVYKFSEGYFTQPFPNWVIGFWIGVIMIISLITGYLLVKDLHRRWKNKGLSSKNDADTNTIEPSIDVEEVK